MNEMITLLGLTFVFVLMLSGLFVTGLGLLVLFHVIRPQKAPADESNRINKLRLIWFAMKHEDKFVDLFPWLKEDEMDQLKQKEKINN